MLKVVLKIYFVSIGVPHMGRNEALQNIYLFNFILMMFFIFITIMREGHVNVVNFFSKKILLH